MKDRIHKLRELLMEAEHCTAWLSQGVSDQTVPADLAILVEASRMGVLAAMRTAHALELAAMLVTPPGGD